MIPTQVAIRVEAEADRLGFEEYPSRMSVYRVLNPIIERKDQKQKIRNIRLDRSFNSDVSSISLD
ncbi:MAG: hypothetical protein SWJ54_04075 [Cyanobacteriota bacterium]|nr:hypothetical protein [Cyanobacteriota bacterium]